MINISILQEKGAEYAKQIVSTLSAQLAWSYFIEILSLKAIEAKPFYTHAAASKTLSLKELCEQISRNAFERTAIANTQLTHNYSVPQGLFKVPYSGYFLGLKANDNN